MTNKKTITEKIIAVTNTMAWKMVWASANSACTWIYHQPEFPKEAEKLKKVR